MTFSPKMTKCTKNITNYWQLTFSLKVRNGDEEMSSLKYFHPQFMSLLRPHPILTTAGHSYDTNKMIRQLWMLSGRYKCGSLLTFHQVFQEYANFACWKRKISLTSFSQVPPFRLSEKLISLIILEISSKITNIGSCHKIITAGQKCPETSGQNL